jgi:hypothetical protein
MLRRLWTMNSSIDVRDALGRVQAPTLVMHRRGDNIVPIRAGRYLGDHIAGARFVELEGEAHFPFCGDTSRPIVEISSALAMARVGRVDHRTMETASSFSGAGEAKLPLENALARLITAEDVDRPVRLGRFVIERKLGRGAMGMVYLAVDRDLDRPVAIKVLSSADADALCRFRQEAIAVARLSHPNVVSIHEIGLDASVPYLVMEYVPGGTVADLLDEPVPWDRAARIVCAAARGLGAAHARGVVHRDVKPANLLLVERGGAFVKVADFGVAKLAGAADPITRQGLLVGSVGYIAPEQAKGEAVDARCDVFSLAVTWYRLVTRRKPFEGTFAQVIAAAPQRFVPDPREACPTLPPSIAALIQRLGAWHREARPADGYHAADEIEAAVAQSSAKEGGMGTAGGRDPF